MATRRARSILVMGVIFIFGGGTIFLTLRTPKLPGNIAGAGSAKFTRSRTKETITTTTTTTETNGVVRAEIITCPACRLNSLPKVKTFVHGDAKLFPKLKITFEFGHDPYLYMYDANGKTVSATDLAPLDGGGIMKQLYKNGIKPSKSTESVIAALGSDAKLEKS